MPTRGGRPGRGKAKMPTSGGRLPRCEAKTPKATFKNKSAMSLGTFHGRPSDVPSMAGISLEQTLLEGQASGTSSIHGLGRIPEIQGSSLSTNCRPTELLQTEQQTETEQQTFQRSAKADFVPALLEFPPLILSKFKPLPKGTSQQEQLDVYNASMQLQQTFNERSEATFKQHTEALKKLEKQVNKLSNIGMQTAIRDLKITAGEIWKHAVGCGGQLQGDGRLYYSPELRPRAQLVLKKLNMEQSEYHLKALTSRVILGRNILGGNNSAHFDTLNLLDEAVNTCLHSMECYDLSLECPDQIETIRMYGILKGDDEPLVFF